MEEEKKDDKADIERYVTDIEELHKLLTIEKDEEIKKLQYENQALRTKPKYQPRKEIKPNENVIKEFIEFFEYSLRKKRFSNFKLKKDLDKRIKNLSDQSVLYFILQQTILYKRGMVILSIKEIREGVRSKYKIFTSGTDLDDKTINLSIESLKAQGIIFRFRHNKQKSILDIFPNNVL